jgi:hypothetical protein
MGTLETIIQMQQNGMTDPQIVATLQQQGISPKDINDGINQAKIKTAVSDPQVPQEPSQEQYPIEQQAGTPEQPQQQEAYAPQPEPQVDPNQQQEQYYQATPQAYSGQEYYQQGAYNTETITEIAEQVFTEKFKQFTEKTGDLAEFKNSTQDKIAEFDQRLKRIESTIDEIQKAIIQKIGEFGEDASTIKRDLNNLHDTTSKLMNPLIDNYRAIQEKKAKPKAKKK